ncbi:MAG: hypothetical protein NZ898_16975, partial [Myxococcota bacterium]|nr:hypothetical protein [Myxococcota bacterium]
SSASSRRGVCMPPSERKNRDSVVCWHAFFRASWLHTPRGDEAQYCASTRGVRAEPESEP